MGDRRGFRYPLDPIRLKNEWELNDLSRELADVNEAVSTQEQRVQTIADDYRQQHAAWNERLRKPMGLTVDVQRLHLAYLARLHDQFHQTRQQLAELEGEREAILSRTQQVKKFGDALDDHRQKAIREHEQQAAAAAMKDADDAWLQRNARKGRV